MIRLEGLLAIFRENLAQGRCKGRHAAHALGAVDHHHYPVGEAAALGNEDLPDDKYNPDPAVLCIRRSTFVKSTNSHFMPTCSTNRPRRFPITSRCTAEKAIGSSKIIIILEARRLFYYTDKSVKGNRL
ncbi:MAG: hypothetical protein IPP17_17710 [Bacteroidetes bacterium]|nr:hypothetical protein [Bacteroidota bacterium]